MFPSTQNKRLKIFIIIPPALGMAVIILAITGCSKKAEALVEAKPPVTEQKPEPPRGVNVFNSFDAHNKFDKAVAWGVMNDGQAEYRGQAEWFEPAGSGGLNVVDLAMAGKGSLNITVAEDHNGQPGNPLERFLNVPSSQIGKSRHLVLVSETHPALKAGTKYWLCAEPADASTSCSWYYNNQNLAQGFAMERGPGAWSFVPGGMRDGAFRINVVP